jgi:hypothetical protein
MTARKRSPALLPNGEPVVTARSLAREARGELRGAIWARGFECAAVVVADYGGSPVARRELEARGAADLAAGVDALAYAEQAETAAEAMERIRAMRVAVGLPADEGNR